MGQTLHSGGLQADGRVGDTGSVQGTGVVVAEMLEWPGEALPVLRFLICEMGLLTLGLEAVPLFGVETDLGRKY